ncbi:MAG: M48 family metalloprotease [Erysipelotrichaceae bacterium]|nr:M48 family metalloprotease [Erysipelotrichaceae bacterium]
MYYKHILFGLICLSQLFSIIKIIITDRQQHLPLPEEGKEIYSPEKYQEFLNYEHDYHPVTALKKIVSLISDALILYLPFFLWMEKLGGGNVYKETILTTVILETFNAIVMLPFSYYSTFVIEEKYGKNKTDQKQFFKDRLLEMMSEMVISLPLLLLLIYIIEHLSAWTHGFAISYRHSFLFAFLLVAAVAAVVFALSIIAYLIQRKQYHYHDLEEGELLEQIKGLLKGCKKKVRRIEVYDESRKSVDKNAYMLKILWYRAIGIADNFLAENSRNELLGVLAHEVGHLKHKKDLLDYLLYLPLLLLVLGIALLLPNMNAILAILSEIISGINTQFNLHSLNYHLLLICLGHLLEPLALLMKLFGNYVSRHNEYEADLNAVKEGYGEELIATFTRMSTDELVDINPARIIEILDYDHPGMINRIKAIRKANQKKTP